MLHRALRIAHKAALAMPEYNYTPMKRTAKKALKAVKI